MPGTEGHVGGADFEPTTTHAEPNSSGSSSINQETGPHRERQHTQQESQVRELMDTLGMNDVETLPSELEAFREHTRSKVSDILESSTEYASAEEKRAAILKLSIESTKTLTQFKNDRKHGTGPMGKLRQWLANPFAKIAAGSAGAIFSVFSPVPLSLGAPALFTGGIRMVVEGIRQLTGAEGKARRSLDAAKSHLEKALAAKLDKELSRMVMNHETAPSDRSTFLEEFVDGIYCNEMDALFTAENGFDEAVNARAKWQNGAPAKGIFAALTMAMPMDIDGIPTALGFMKGGDFDSHFVFAFDKFWKGGMSWGDVGLLSGDTVVNFLSLGTNVLASHLGKVGAQWLMGKGDQKPVSLSNARVQAPREPITQPASAEVRATTPIATPRSRSGSLHTPAPTRTTPAAAAPIPMPSIPKPATATIAKPAGSTLPIPSSPKLASAQIGTVGNWPSSTIMASPKPAEPETVNDLHEPAEAETVKEFANWLNQIQIFSEDVHNMESTVLEGYLDVLTKEQQVGNPRTVLVPREQDAETWEIQTNELLAGAVASLEWFNRHKQQNAAPIEATIAASRYDSLNRYVQEFSTALMGQTGFDPNGPLASQLEEFDKELQANKAWVAKLSKENPTADANEVTQQVNSLIAEIENIPAGPDQQQTRLDVVAEALRQNKSKHEPKLKAFIARLENALAAGLQFTYTDGQTTQVLQPGSLRIEVKTVPIPHKTAPELAKLKYLSDSLIDFAKQPTEVVKEVLDQANQNTTWRQILNRGGAGIDATKLSQQLETWLSIDLQKEATVGNAADLLALPLTLLKMSDKQVEHFIKQLKANRGAEAAELLRKFKYLITLTSIVSREEGTDSAASERVQQQFTNAYLPIENSTRVGQKMLSVKGTFTPSGEEKDLSSVLADPTASIELPTKPTIGGS